MNIKINEAVLQIEKQQKGKENTAVFMVGEQLKDIIADDERLAELALQDLQNPDMSLVKCEAKIHAHADELHKKNGGNCACVNPKDAENIICEFYGLYKTTASAADNKYKPMSLADLL